MRVQHPQFGEREFPDGTPPQDIDKFYRNLKLLSNIMNIAGNVAGSFAPAPPIGSTLPQMGGASMFGLSRASGQSLMDRMQRANEVQQQAQQQNYFQQELMRQRQREQVGRELESEKDRAQQLKLEAARQANQEKAMKLQMKQQKELAEAQESGAMERARLEAMTREQDRNARLLESMLRLQSTGASRVLRPQIFGSAQTGYYALDPGASTPRRLTGPPEPGEKRDERTEAYWNAHDEAIEKGLIGDEIDEYVAQKMRRYDGGPRPGHVRRYLDDGSPVDVLIREKPQGNPGIWGWFGG